jgi:hypothetical protein
MSPGSTATFAGNISQCHFCGSMEPIPDGKFMATINGFIDLLSSSDDPIQEAKDLLADLKKAKDKGNLSELKNKDKIEKFLNDHKLKINIAIIILTALLNMLLSKPKVEIDSTIINNEFVNYYNQQINIDIDINNEK